MLTRIPVKCAFESERGLATMVVELGRLTYRQTPCVLRIFENEYPCVAAALGNGTVRLVAPIDVMTYEAGTNAFLIGMTFPTGDSARPTNRLKRLQQRVVHQRRSPTDQRALERLFTIGQKIHSSDEEP